MAGLIAGGVGVEGTVEVARAYLRLGGVWEGFVGEVLVVAGAVRELRLEGLAFARGVVGVLDGDGAVGGVADADVAALLGNVLLACRGVWAAGDAGLLLALVRAVSALVRRLPEPAGADSDDDDAADALAADLAQGLARVAAEDNVRVLFDVAADAGREATMRACELFNLLARRDPAGRAGVQSSQAFWRGGAGRPHVLGRLWALCVERGRRGVVLDLRRGEGAILSVFARAYSHFLYLQDVDEVFDSGRLFSVGEVREIAQVLKKTLYTALYSRPSPGSAGSALEAAVVVEGEERGGVATVSAAANVIRGSPDLLSDVAYLLSNLYVCDSRRPFRTSDDFWIAGDGTLSSQLFIQDAIDAGAEAFLPSGDGLTLQRHSMFGESRSSPAAAAAGGSGGRTVNGAVQLLRVAPYMAPFDSRARIFHQWLAVEREKFSGHAVLAGLNGRWISVRRGSLLQDAFDKLHGLRHEIKRSLRVRFIDEHGMEEAGIDGGGVFKEFMFEVLRHAFSPSLYGLFAETEDGKLYPNPSAHLVDELYEQRFEFIGMLLGKALFDGVLVDIPLASFFLAKMLGKFNFPSDLRSLDPELHRNLMLLRKYDSAELVDSLGLNFVIANADFGQNTEVELVRGGRNIPVTLANRIEYIHRVSDYRMNRQLRKQSDAFIRGFSDVIQPEFIQLFSEPELQLLLSGSTSALDVHDLQQNTRYSGGYAADTEVIKWFWQAVDLLAPADQAKLLQFVTSSPRAPLLGFAYLNPAFCVHRAEGDARLPTASTCLNLLKLPHYKDFDTLLAKLRYSLESNSGFDLS